MMYLARFLLIPALFCAAVLPAFAQDDPGTISCADESLAAKPDAWRHAREANAAVGWKFENGIMTNGGEHGHDICTRDEWKDCEVSLEYKIVPGGNSGVYLRGRIEVQILDSYGKEKVGKGDNGAIYDQFRPKVNASKPAGEWNLLEARLVGDRLTVTLNGQVVQDDIRLRAVTGGAIPGGLLDAGPLMLQGDHGEVWFRNIRVKGVAAAAAVK